MTDTHRYPWTTTIHYTDGTTANVDFATHPQALDFAAAVTKPGNQTTDPRRTTVTRKKTAHVANR